MLTTINTRIVDNDHDGKLSRGTMYQLEIKVNSDVRLLETYSLLDVLEGKIDLESIKRPFKERQRQYDNNQDQQIKQLKQVEAQERKNAVVATLELDQLLDEAISMNTKASLEFKNGKEKSINVIIGYVLKEIKKRNMVVNDVAFVVSTLLKQKLTS